jgi:hypothetical protein
MIRFISLLLLFLPGLLQAAPGYDVIGLAKYCDRYLQAPRLPQVSVLLRSFGDPLPCIEKDLQRGGKIKVQYVLRDATCWRNRACPPGTPGLQDWGDMKQLASQVNKLAVKYPGVKHEISPYLEHDFKDAAVIKKACQVALSQCPSCSCINEPFSGTKNTGFPLELHGTKTRAWSVSGDGASMFDGDNLKNDGNDFQHRISGSDSTYAWIDAFNLRCQGMKNFVPINQRTAKPTEDHFKQAHKIMTTEEDPVPQQAPGICKSLRKVQGGEIVKTNAEKYCNPETGDPRGDKPLLIIKKAGSKGEKMKVFSPGGKEVGCFKYYGVYQGNLHRWYMGDCSGQKPFELYKQLGQEWGFAHIGKGECLLFNSLRRMGSYR